MSLRGTITGESDHILLAYLTEIEIRESEGSIRHLPRGRGNLTSAEVVFGEVVREAVLQRFMFNLVSPQVRNFVLD